MASILRQIGPEAGTMRGTSRVPRKDLSRTLSLSDERVFFNYCWGINIGRCHTEHSFFCNRERISALFGKAVTQMSRRQAMRLLMMTFSVVSLVGSLVICQTKSGAAGIGIHRVFFTGSSPLLILDNGLSPSAVPIRNMETICMATNWIGHYPLIAQRVDSAGRLLWKTVQISNPQNSIDQDGKGLILPRLDGGAYSIFEFWEFKQREGDALLYASFPHIQLVDASGSVLWGVDGKRMTNLSVGYQGGGQVLLTNFSSEGNVIAYWDWFSEDSLYNRSYGVYVQKIDAATGRLQWGDAGRKLFDCSPAFAVSNRYGITYIGHRDSAACFDSEGRLRWDYPVLTGITDQMEFTVGNDDDGELLILYTSSEGIRGRLYGSDGQPRWIDKLIVPGASRIFAGTKLTQWGSSRWVFKMGQVGNTVYCIDRNGALNWSASGVVDRILAVHPVDSDNVFVAFQKPREGEAFTYDLWLQKLNSTGEIVWQNGAVKIVETVGTNCLLLPDSAGGAFLVFDALAQYEPTYRSRGTYFHRIDRDGNPGILAAISQEDPNQNVSLSASATSYPNPFTSETTIRLSTTSSSLHEHARLVIYDILGREVRKYDIQNPSGGIFSVRWDGRDNRGAEVAPGIYFYGASTKDNVVLRGRLLHIR
jgi:hypothetical protein